MFLALESITKTYGERRVLDAVSFTVEKGEMVSLIGPSGAGKTTLLKIIAGLERPEDGRVISTADLQNNPAILVFQDYILFPTMSVFDNVAFGLRCRKRDRREIGRRVMAMLDYFQLGEKAQQFPAQLSAGQQQRVALARAMVVSPSILLLDEPFANLDRNLKAETAEFIRSFQQEYQITTISVTHDLQEAFMMSDKIGILLDGALCQFGNVRDMYDKPASARVAAFLGHVNIIPPEWRHLVGLAPVAGDRVGTIGVRAESVELRKAADGSGVVDNVIFAGHYVIYQVRIEDLTISCYRFSPDLDIGDRVSISISQYLNFTEEKP